MLAEGHATGSDAVCAAVSAITLSLLGYVATLEKRGEAKIWEQKVEEGLFCLCAQGDERCKGAFAMAIHGLCQLENSFPQYISVKK